MRSAFGADRVRANEPLAPWTTFKVGGPAEWYFEARSSDEVVTAIRVARQHDLAITMLGGGSNVLIADSGIRGLVVRWRGGDIIQLDRLVRADAAVTINGLVRWTITHGCAGLEAWAGTPGTVGGAIFGNAHFGGRLIGDLVARVRLATRDGDVIDAARDDMAFGYDQSRLQGTGEILLSADFIVSPGDPQALRRIARESLAFRKRTQPLDTPSAGCIFQNPQPDRDVVPPDIPWSAGALVNDGAATARDIRALIDRCKADVRTRFGVELREEIVYLGDFSDVQP
jgi:UDP-N-acetylmuramate dehydrogenase